MSECHRWLNRGCVTLSSLPLQTWGCFMVGFQLSLVCSSYAETLVRRQQDEGSKNKPQYQTLHLGPRALSPDKCLCAAQGADSIPQVDYVVLACSTATPDFPLLFDFLLRIMHLLVAI